MQLRRLRLNRGTKQITESAVTELIRVQVSAVEDTHSSVHGTGGHGQRADTPGHQAN